MNQTKSRNYIFTINNYTKKMLVRFENVAKSLDKHRYICYGLEIAPKTKTKHIQGYIQLSDNQRFTFLHNYFDLKKRGKKDKFHIQSAKGTASQNREYTSKNGEWFEFGEPKQEGRSDLVNIKEKISENPKDIKNIVREACDNNQQLRYAENLQKYYLEERNPKQPPIVIWIYGNAGVGKSRLIYKSFKSICSVSDYKWPGNGYIQQECFLLDDFREEDLSFNTLLKITDRYPFDLPFKGGFIPLNSEYIIITSPQSISATFTFINEDLQQLYRRVTIEINLNQEKIINLKKYISKRFPDINKNDSFS